MIVLQPPAGYDAVVGEPGYDLNYDESIGEFNSVAVKERSMTDLLQSTGFVYSAPNRLRVFSLSETQNDAIRPSFLVMFC
jgi:hypothetical protein